MCSLSRQPSLARTTNHFDYQTKLDRHSNRVTGRYKPTIFLPLWFAPTVSLVLVKPHYFESSGSAGLSLRVRVCIELVSIIFHSAMIVASIIIFFKYFFMLENIEKAVAKALEWHRSISMRYQRWLYIHTMCGLLTSRLMILSAVRWIRRDSVCICACSKCSKLRKHGGDKQSSPSPPYSWTSRDTHCRDSSHTSWFSLENCKKTKLANICNNKLYMNMFLFLLLWVTQTAESKQGYWECYSSA